MRQVRGRVILAITGASGALLGIRTLELLRPAGKETHLVISTAARLTIPTELRTETTDVVLVELTKQAGERFQFRQWK